MNEITETVKTEKRRNPRMGTEGPAIFRALVEKEESTNGGAATERRIPCLKSNHGDGELNILAERIHW